LLPQSLNPSGSTCVAPQSQSGQAIKAAKFFSILIYLYIRDSKPAPYLGRQPRTIQTVPSRLSPPPFILISASVIHGMSNYD
jgi:hypothetical protein